MAGPGSDTRILARSLGTEKGMLRAVLRRVKATSVAKLTDDGLLEALHEACREANRLLGRLIVLLNEVDDRRLHLKEAYPSLFEFCRTELRMSEGEAFRRINAARLVRRFPQLLDRLVRGDVHLSALVQLRDHLTNENVDDLVDAAKGKNKMQIAELVARIAPRPDVPAKLRKIPQYDRGSRVTSERKPSLEPLSEERYRFEMTGSREFRDKLLRLRDFMMHSNPHGDLAVVVERAVDDLLEEYEKKFFGKPSRRRVEPTTDASGVTEKGTDGAARNERSKETPLRGLARAKLSTGGMAASTRGRRHAGDVTFASASSAQTPGLKRVKVSTPTPVVRSG